MTFEWIAAGGVTSPQGFKAGGAYAGIKTYGPEPRLDVGLLLSDVPATVAGVFTTNRICGAPVTLCRERLQGGSARALVVNSGCSNVAVAQGLEDSRQMTQWAAAHLGVSEQETFVASTGVIGRRLPLDKLKATIPTVAVSREGGAAFSRAMMTTDTVQKQRALQFTVNGTQYTLGAAAKGVGMAHPNMATVLCFLTTDAPVEAQFLQLTLRTIADRTLNMIDVDMDTSTSDTMLLFANGKAGGASIAAGKPGAPEFEAALLQLCTAIARDLARDGEGARTLIEVVCNNALSEKDARLVARTVVSSPLVKTMVTGRDPNPGRVLMAAGRSGAEVDASKISVWIGGKPAFQNGAPTETPYDALRQAMNTDELQLVVDLGLGDQSATAWGCDLTEDYIKVNASYTT
ncbi:MAG TPA: bifunctional glutamate N-acetyltransferase/amino-acid acetyltransferase ArgJ [Polyangiaceae bacterium]|nr:bifunctional glutamate N-acetyltransferase/amino-acid acetyltransferase ArgJ [Polyangiaceae bacterium]